MLPVFAFLGCVLSGVTGFYFRGAPDVAALVAVSSISGLVALVVALKKKS